MLGLILSSAEKSMESASAGSIITSFIVGIIGVISLWVLFNKAGEPGFCAIIPIVDAYILFKIVFGNGLKFLWLFVPFVNIYFGIKAYIGLAKAFGKSTGFGILMLLFPYVCLPILAFDGSSYEGAPY